MLSFKYQKETEKELAHTKVYFNNEYLGYYMPNRSKSASLDENWNFVSESNKVKYFHAKTRQELIEILTKQVNQEPVQLKQHFGIVVEQ